MGVPEFIAGFEDQSPFLQTCEMEEEQFRIEPFALVIFGGAGDLSQRKLIPTIYRIFSEGTLPGTFAIIGVGVPAMADGEYRDLMREAVARSEEGPADGEKWDAFASHLFYVSGGLESEGTYLYLRQRMQSMAGQCAGSAIYYLAVPPGVSPMIVEKLRDLKLCRVGDAAKVIIEKPFGHDRRSAVELNDLILTAFSEQQIYRIDHYLGKETVQNISFFRFSNTIFERLWNSQYIDHVQITVAEDIGIEHRGAFYEEAGVVRDIVQNHLLQLVALVAMEPPVGFTADFIRDEKVKVFRSIRPMTPGEIDRFTVMGQYGPGEVEGRRVAAYREEDAVAPDSMTPTFIAARLTVANWRWAGVPFYVRAGKRLVRRVTEICIQFKQPPLRLFGRTCDALEPNILVLTIQPDERIFLRFGVKYPKASNKIYPVRVDFRYQDVFREKPHPPYARLLEDCMKGDQTLFVRQDGVEATWALADPIIERWESSRPGKFHIYEGGTWGPPESQRLIESEGRRWITA